MSDIIKMEHISKIYEIGGEEVKALDDANISIGKGDFIGVVGPSGSGKSTLMNIMGCLDTATYGTYYLDGLEIGDYSQNMLAHIRNEKIGFIFQNFNLLPKLTAYENIELPLIYRGIHSAERKMLVDGAIEMVGLGKRRFHKPKELSGGQQQRVAIARALVGDPALLLADEPTGNLDSATGAEVLNLFISLNNAGKTIVLITHDMKVADHTKRRFYISDGHVSETQGN